MREREPDAVFLAAGYQYLGLDAAEATLAIAREETLRAGLCKETCGGSRCGRKWMRSDRRPEFQLHD